MGIDENYLLEAAQCKSQAAQQEQELAIVGALGLTPYKDGNKWCVLWGVNIQEGVCAFGDTPAAAVFNFNEAYYGKNQ